MPTSKVLLALILIVCLIVPARVVLAQQPPVQQQLPPRQPPAPAPQPVIENLRIIVLEGEGAINNIEKHTAKVPIVEIRDDNFKPVEGAEVVFRLPLSGPGGSFPGQAPSKTGRTNVQGQVAATGFVPNSETGHFTIKVTASIGNRVGQADISQTNAIGAMSEIEKPHKLLGLGWKKLAIIGGIAGGAITAILLTTGGGGSSSDKPTITITPGQVIIGGR